MFIMVCAYVRACVNLYRALKGEKKKHKLSYESS